MAKDGRGRELPLKGTEGAGGIGKPVKGIVAGLEAGEPLMRASPAIGCLVYPFFLLHMFVFGLSGFFLAYSGFSDVSILFMHSGAAISVYLFFYLFIFGPEEVKWMLINAGLGVLGITSQIGWFLRAFGKRIGDYPWYVHVAPFLYYVLYTFLLRQMLIDITRSRNNPVRRKWVDTAYVAVSLGAYGWLLWRA